MIKERRLARLNVLFRNEIADILENRMGDPRLNLVTVTEVSISADLSVASVYVSKLGTDEERSEGLSILRQAAPFVRGELARKIRHIRQIPMLHFYLDESVESGKRVDDLIQQWHEESS